MNRSATRTPRGIALAALLAVALGLPAPAAALEATWSGFATLGYARSDSSHRHQRYIDRDGTLKRDSLLAGQLDLQLAPRWSATVQAKLAAPNDRDAGLRTRATWAFVAWRPADEWLLRAGRIRLPLHMHSESLDVGVARDRLRMPHEMYSVSPTSEINGLAAARTLWWGETELALDAFSGTDRTATRIWFSQGIAGAVPAGANYERVRTRFSGLTLAARDGGFTARVGLGWSATRHTDGRGFPVRFPRVEVAPGVGYWKVDAALPGPDIETVQRLRNELLSVGAEWHFGSGWRLQGEAVRIHSSDADFFYDSKAAHAGLFKRIGDFTPYVGAARQRSGRRGLEWFRRLTEQPLPAALPMAPAIDAAQRLAAEATLPIDQRSLMLGTAYALSPRAKLHAEWMRTTVGRASMHVDVPAGAVGNAGVRIRTTSLALSVAF